LGLLDLLESRSDGITLVQGSEESVGIGLGSATRGWECSSGWGSRGRWRLGSSGSSRSSRAGVSTSWIPGKLGSVVLLDVSSQLLEEVVPVRNPFDLSLILLLEFNENLVGVKFR